MAINARSDDADHACALDAADPLAAQRDKFDLPPRGTYLCSNSLGALPRAARTTLARELDRWGTLGIEGHFDGDESWYGYADRLRPAMAKLVGADASEVVLMNGLTVNLHLLLASFYRPTRDKFQIVMDAPVFPSDLYAVQTQLRSHGFDPEAGLIALRPLAGQTALDLELLEDWLAQHHATTALILWNGVNFVTGQWFDLERLARLAQKYGITLGLDLAHAVGNVPLNLHAWGVDFAVWCSYKYLCGGPGGPGGAFVHERHGQRSDLPRLGGWWGNDPATRFDMDRQLHFVPHSGAAAWQVSNHCVLALAPLAASLPIFDAVGMDRLRAKSVQLTGYLGERLERMREGRFTVMTPDDPGRRGCMLTLAIKDRPRETFERITHAGVTCDFRPPNVIRLAPAPLYNSFMDVWQATQIIANVLG